jgi:hypothetical protein
MFVLRSSVLWSFGFLLLSGAASLTLAQEIQDDGLRTNTLVEDESLSTAISDSSRITIGDDEALATRRRRIEDDAFAPQGIDTGGLTLFPSLEINSVVTSNVAESSNDADGDVALGLRP